MMFSETSKARLNTCHQDLITLFNAVVLDDDCSIICGHRGEKEQQEAFAAGLSRIQWPNGKHNSLPSMAVDVMPYLPVVGIDWKDSKAIYMFVGKVIAKARQLRRTGEMKHDLRVGADWNGDGRTSDQQFHDAVHFELVTL
jgi:peptidoglycan L-alanyl-D-glutamate endopeptidase CwlK